MLKTYNLMSTVCFPTRTVNNSATLIDNIFIDSRRNYTIKPCINGLSDHDAQLIIFNNVPISNKTPEFMYFRNMNNNTTKEFEFLLSMELWDDIFGNNNVNIMFNNFHNTYLRWSYACFSKKRIIQNSNCNKWITKGIRISCNKKKEYILKGSDDGV
jgi:hypothetical protein